MTDSQLCDVTRRIDSLVITAASVPEMHRKLNALRSNSSRNWQLLRSPCWKDGRVVAVVVKPSADIEENLSDERP